MICVGATVNGLGLIVYLFLTRSGMGPKLVATICFLGGVAVGFILNRNWTFRDPTYMRYTLPRYTVAYAVAYAVDIAGLYVFVDRMGYGHEIVQIALVMVIACGLFLAQKYWIFYDTSGATNPSNDEPRCVVDRTD